VERSAASSWLGLLLGREEEEAVGNQFLGALIMERKVSIRAVPTAQVHA